MLTVELICEVERNRASDTDKLNLLSRLIKADLLSVFEGHYLPTFEHFERKGLINAKGEVNWPRYCDVTKKGMVDGWCIGDGQAYAIDNEALADWLRAHGYDDPEQPLSDEFLVNEAWQQDHAYFTDWMDIDPEDFHEPPTT